jgi:hypothetical protein
VLRLLAARAALVWLVALTVLLAPSVGWLAVYGHDWTARLIMAGLLGATWCAVFALGAARENFRRVRA